MFMRHSARRDTRVATTKLGLVRCYDYLLHIPSFWLIVMITIVDLEWGVSHRSVLPRIYQFCIRYMCVMRFFNFTQPLSLSWRVIAHPRSNFGQDNSLYRQQITCYQLSIINLISGVVVSASDNLDIQRRWLSIRRLSTSTRSSVNRLHRGIPILPAQPQYSYGEQLDFGTLSHDQGGWDGVAPECSNFLYTTTNSSTPLVANQCYSVGAS